jgi:hypothetical protein
MDRTKAGSNGDRLPDRGLPWSSSPRRDEASLGHPRDTLEGLESSGSPRSYFTSEVDVRWRGVDLRGLSQDLEGFDEFHQSYRGFRARRDVFRNSVA